MLFFSLLDINSRYSWHILTGISCAMYELLCFGWRYMCACRYNLTCVFSMIWALFCSLGVHRLQEWKGLGDYCWVLIHMDALFTTNLSLFAEFVGVAVSPHLNIVFRCKERKFVYITPISYIPWRGILCQALSLEKLSQAWPFFQS